MFSLANHPQPAVCLLTERLYGLFECAGNACSAVVKAYMITGRPCQ